MVLSKIKKVVDALMNIFDRKNRLIYITEANDWSIDWDGRQITAALNGLGLIKSRTAVSAAFLKNKIVHFGSINCFFNRRGEPLKIHSSDKKVLTWFHVSPADSRIKIIPYLNEQVDLIHTSCQATRAELVKNGLNDRKIIVIPLGVNLKIFKKAEPEKREIFLKRLGLPKDKIIIGSFQKDGNGWGEGLKPKLIKGPDVFCDVLEKLAAKYPVHVLLTGPARGYVKARLAKAGIGYTHKYLKNYQGIADYYNCLDLYLICSRVEGGPKALWESWATGVPVVSTKMGMPADFIVNGQNGLLVEVGDVDGLAAAAEKILDDKVLREKLVSNALADVKEHSWDKLAEDYYEKIYKKLLS